MLVRSGTSSNHSAGSTQNTPTSTPSVTPKMSVVFFNRNIVKVGYFGKLGFFDNQAAFAEVFGDKPTTIDPDIITSQYTTSTARRLYFFVKNCKLDVFLHMCRKYYVGYDSVDNSLSVQDLCRQISEIKK